MTVEIIVPAPAFAPVRKRATGKLQAVNPWLNSNDRLHRQQEAKLTAAWRDAGAQAAAGLEPVTGLVLIWAHVVKPRANRYDPANFYPTAKAVVDGFRDAGLLVDDDWRHVVGPFMLAGTKGPDALTLTVGHVLENVVPLLPFAKWQA